jgi:hypothetical protein
VSDDTKFAAVPYDLTEAAIKELYSDLEVRRNRNDPGPTADLRRTAAPQNPTDAVPPSTPGAKAQTISGGVSSVARRRRPRRAIRRFVVALTAAVLLAAGLSHANQIRAFLASYFRQRPPSIIGILHAADLAAGHGLNPGETYEVDIPPGTVKIAVVSGRVALVTKDGATLRLCSKEPFTLEPVQGSNPLVSSCGGKASFIQAVIPQPPLPSAVPEGPYRP